MNRCLSKASLSPIVVNPAQTISLGTIQMTSFTTSCRTVVVLRWLQL